MNSQEFKNHTHHVLSNLQRRGLGGVKGTVFSEPRPMQHLECSERSHLLPYSQKAIDNIVLVRASNDAHALTAGVRGGPAL